MLPPPAYPRCRLALLAAQFKFVCVEASRQNRLTQPHHAPARQYSATPVPDGPLSTRSFPHLPPRPPLTAPQLESVHINRSEPSLWLAFEYAEYDLYEMIKFHRDHRENRRDNPYGAQPCNSWGDETV